MPQSGRDKPAEPAGPTPGQTGVVEPQGAGQPLPPNGQPAGQQPPAEPPVPPARQPAPPADSPQPPSVPPAAGEAFPPASPDQPDAEQPYPVAPGQQPYPMAPGQQPYPVGAGEPVDPVAFPPAGQVFPPAGWPVTPDGQPLPPAGWRPLAVPPRPSVWRPTGREVRAAIVVIVLLAIVGAGVAVLWLQVAPRLGFRVVAPNSPEPVTAEQEQFFATDGWFTLLTLLVGVLATLLAWRVKALRGPVGMVALAVGGLVGAVVTWRLGLLLAPAPTAAQLQEVGRVVYPALRLRATAALMVEPLVAVGVYLLLVGFASRPDLGRGDGEPPRPPLPPSY
jgi:uncharacterized membrane protein YeaQ/YmgE (transglycosylase-associated protein family)